LSLTNKTEESRLYRVSVSG